MKRLCILLVVITSCLWTWLPLAHASQSRSLPDFDENGIVDLPDFLLFASKFGSKQGDETYEDRYDLDGDGAIAFSDFLIFASNFGKTVPRTMDGMINFPLRAIHAAGNWGDTGHVAAIMPSAISCPRKSCDRLMRPMLNHLVIDTSALSLSNTGNITLIA